MVKECSLSTGRLPPGGLPRNGVVRITDHPDMTSVVNHGCKATNQTKQNNCHYSQGLVSINISRNILMQ